jgi:hypothetical protein
LTFLMSRLTASVGPLEQPPVACQARIWASKLVRCGQGVTARPRQRRLPNGRSAPGWRGPPAWPCAVGRVIP